MQQPPSLKLERENTAALLTPRRTAVRKQLPRLLRSHVTRAENPS